MQTTRWKSKTKQEIKSDEHDWQEVETSDGDGPPDAYSWLGPGEDLLTRAYAGDCELGKVSDCVGAE